MGNRFRPAPDTEFGVDVEQVPLDGADAQNETIGDLGAWTSQPVLDGLQMQVPVRFPAREV